MDINDLRKSNRIIFECIAGSIAYGLNTPDSDTDTRGIFINPNKEYLSLKEPSSQISDETNDIVFYSLKRFFELLMTANPNLIELLWMPEDCIIKREPIFDILHENRSLFISKKAYFTHVAYANAQIKKAKGQNKRVHNPCPKERPSKEDFCYVILERNLNFSDISWCEKNGWTNSNGVYPFRPVPLKLSKPKIDLNDYHVASLEHVSNVYRLYYYGRSSKGVFRGDDMLVCESIPKEDEWNKCDGLLIYNANEYERAVKEWHSYWDWVNNRNEARWKLQEEKIVDFDCKNMSHCMRLLISGENILRNNSPLVRFQGEQKDYLMAIKMGEVPYDEIMSVVENKMVELEKLYETSMIPHSVDLKKITELYEKICEQSI